MNRAGEEQVSGATDVSKGRAIRSRVHGRNRYYWLFAMALVLISLFTSLFDYSLFPRSFKGLIISRPHYGLHSWASARDAWTARSHVKYGFGYTGGYPTFAVGDPPAQRPMHDVSHPPMNSWIAALGTLLLGTEDWSLRLFDILLSIPLLIVILHFLRVLLGDRVALLTGLLLVLFPMSAYSGFDAKRVALCLWMVCRYLSLIGKLPGAKPSYSRRYLIELSIALFLTVQLDWVGICYAIVIAFHYGVHCLRTRRLQFGLTLIVVVVPIVSVGLNSLMMVRGFQLNNRAAQLSRMAASEAAEEQEASRWDLIKTLLVGRTESTEAKTFSWPAWLGRHGESALSNFTFPVLFLLIVYLVYWLLAHFRLALAKVLNPVSVRDSGKIPYGFDYMWFYFWPSALFLLTFEGWIGRHQYGQAPIAIFVAIVCCQCIFLLSRFAALLGRWLGQVVFIGLIFVTIIHCNRGLVAYRDVHWQSPYTLDLFKRLNRDIPPDQALLTFKDYEILRTEAKVRFYRPEYAWYLDREMVVANAWPSDRFSAMAARVADVVSDTVDEIRMQAASRRFPFYYIPESRKPGEYLSSYAVLFKLQEQPDELAALTNLEVHRLLNDGNWRDHEDKLFQEKFHRYHTLLIRKLKKLYSFEHVPNPAFANHRDYCQWGDTPGYLFDLKRPIPEGP